MEEINCIGWQCPQPIIEVAKAIARISPGDSLILLADDPFILLDLRAWARMTDNEVNPLSETRFKVTRRTQNERDAR